MSKSYIWTLVSLHYSAICHTLLGTLNSVMLGIQLMVNWIKDLILARLAEIWDWTTISCQMHSCPRSYEDMTACMCMLIFDFSREHCDTNKALQKKDNSSFSLNHLKILVGMYMLLRNIWFEWDDDTKNAYSRRESHSIKYTVGKMWQLDYLAA